MKRKVTTDAGDITIEQITPNTVKIILHASEERPENVKLEVVNGDTGESVVLDWMILKQ